jgi:hypothetical protein
MDVKTRCYETLYIEFLYLMWFVRNKIRHIFRKCEVYGGIYVLWLLAQNWASSEVLEN